jgi:hypothetical protein
MNEKDLKEISDILHRAVQDVEDFARELQSVVLSIDGIRVEKRRSIFRRILRFFSRW